MRKHITYNPRFDSGLSSFRHVRWIENVSDGLRLVGFADELTSIDHRGWYIDEHQGEVYRGVVYRLPHGRFAYGYADPFYDDCALLCFDNDAEDEREAARWANQLAEYMAEHEREHQAKWQARRTVDDAREAIANARREHTRLVREIQAARSVADVYAHGVGADSAICAALRRQLARLRGDVRAARREIASTLREYGDEILSDEYA